MNKKQVIRINESQLRRIVTESVKRIIKENLENTDVGEPPYSVWADGSLLQTDIQDYYEAEDLANSLNNREIYIIDGDGEEVFSIKHKG